MSISAPAIMAEVFQNHRRRGHRVECLNAMDDSIEKAKSQRKDGVDISYWKFSDNVYKQQFFTRNTWRLLWIGQTVKLWYKGVWLSHATPKYTFLTWLAIQNRLTTEDRMRSWSSGQNTECILCKAAEETRNHIFFECSYFEEIWKGTIEAYRGSYYCTGSNRELPHVLST